MPDHCPRTRHRMSAVHAMMPTDRGALQIMYSFYQGSFKVLYVRDFNRGPFCPGNFYTLLAWLSLWGTSFLSA